ncbi:MAG: chorismate mutase [Lachnospiraceae bacterium]|jgi:monofunctional chorismate mutase|nr:chorismate mutase [Lachnospiraceae bacterium]
MDDRLKDSRARINQIDRELIRLFEERMEAVKQVAEYKRDNHVEIFDPGREKEIITQNASYIKDPVLVPYAKRFLESNMEISRDYQSTLLDIKKC